LDVVDTGGVTIPAPPVEPESREDSVPEVQKNSECSGKNNGESVSETEQPIFENANIVSKTGSDPARCLPSLTTVGPIQQLGQTTYILLPPNTPLRFLSNTSVLSAGVSQTLLENQIIAETNSASYKNKPDKPCPIGTNHLSTVETALAAQESGETGKENTFATKDKDSRVFTPFNSSHPNQLLESMPQLNALDLAEVINACNQPSSSNDSMFEKLLGMSGM